MTQGYGTVLGSIAFNNIKDFALLSRGWWDVRDGEGHYVTRITRYEDHERDERMFASRYTVTDDDVLTLAQTVYPQATRVHEADAMIDAGVVPTWTLGYVILKE